MLLVMATFVSIWASGQNIISPITINLPANPPANTAEWATTLPPAMVIAQTKLTNGQINPTVIESRILVTIKKGGTKVCGTYTAQTAPMSGFNSASKNWSGSNLIALLGQECTLQPGSYELCVEFYSLAGTVATRLLGQSCKPFTIAEKNIETFSPPVNVMPTNKKIFTKKEINAPLTFRWTPIIPKPKLPVTYRLKVWQLMQGQNSAAAMKSNAPLLEKEIANLTQATITNLLDGPCHPPYMCDFVWSVEASIQSQTGGVEVVGSSEPTAFMVSSAGCGTNKDSVKISCGEVIQGVQTYQVTVIFNNVIPTAGGQQCTTIMNSITSSSGTISGIATLPVTIPIGGNAPAVTFTYTPTIVGATTAAFLYQGIWNDGFSNTSNFGNSNVSLPLCICSDCKDATVTVSSPSVNVTNPLNGIYTATGSLNITGMPAIYGVEMQIVSYTYSATPTACSNGVTSVETSGVFNGTSSTINGMPVAMLNETTSGLGSTNNGVAKNIKLTSTTPLPSSLPFSLSIGLPTPLAGLNADCCKMSYTLCIKIKVFYDKDKCNSCTFNYCFPAFTN